MRRAPSLHSSKAARALRFAGDLLRRTEKEYELFVQSLDIVGIGLASCVCSIDRSAYFKLKSKMLSFDHEYELMKSEADYFDALGKFSVATGPGGNNQPSLAIECAFMCHILGKSPISKEHAERFTNSELRLVLVPYARQFVASITSRMYIPTLTLPLAVRSNASADLNEVE